MQSLQQPPILDTDWMSLDVPALEALVRHHNHLYWDKNAPELSDTEFDRLVRRLRELAPESPALAEMGPNGSAADLGRYGASVRHHRLMLSLEKCYGDDDLREWAETFEGDVVLSPKFDGIAASIHYDEGGALVLAATRGDGQVGDDITANARAIADIPKRVAVQSEKGVEVRGEIFMRLSVFARYKDKFANPRNLTAGAIKQKDSRKSAAYQLSFAAYDLAGLSLPTERQKLEYLVTMGFAPIECHVVPKEQAVEAYRELASRRAELDFEIDGVVFKADRTDEQERLGCTAHHPRYAIAYKFQGDTGTTVVRDIAWSVARTGAITPIALIDPVVLSGALVSRASLHHSGYLAKLGLTRNAEVLVTRRGGVIPNVEHVTKAGDALFAIPTLCPSCGCDVHGSGDFLYCDNPDTCRAAVIGQIAHYVAVTGIEGFGDRMLGELYERKLVRSPADLYRLQVADLLPIERVGDKLARKLVAEVERHRILPLATFLRSLGLDELGKHVSKVLASEYGSLSRILSAKSEELSAIHSIGDTIANVVTEGLARSRTRIEELLRYVTVLNAARDANKGDDKLTEQSHQDGPQHGPLSGKSFVFTGKMASLDRKSAQEEVLAWGGSTPENVTKHLTYLVIGDDKIDGKKSTKEKTAAKLIAAGAPIRILSETEFLKLLPNAMDSTPQGGIL